MNNFLFLLYVKKKYFANVRDCKMHNILILYLNIKFHCLYSKTDSFNSPLKYLNKQTRSKG